MTPEQNSRERLGRRTPSSTCVMPGQTQTQTQTQAQTQAQAQAQAGVPAPRAMVHIDRGGDNGGSRWFYDHVVERGVGCDLIGQSYDWFWHGPIQDLEANGDDLENIIFFSADQLPDVAVRPPTTDGQVAYFAVLRDVFGRVPGRHGLGFVTWEPEWVPGVGWTPGQGNPNDNLTLFDHDGGALPALSAFSPGRTVVR